MSHQNCCRPPNRSLARRSLNGARWIVPGAILAIVPKCPLCLAAYIAAGAGIGVSLTAATYMRLSLIILCAASLLVVTVRYLRSFVIPRNSALTARQGGSPRHKI
jgi:hypothetical protein